MWGKLPVWIFLLLSFGFSAAGYSQCTDTIRWRTNTEFWEIESIDQIDPYDRFDSINNVYAIDFWPPHSSNFPALCKKTATGWKVWRVWEFVGSYDNWMKISRIRMAGIGTSLIKVEFRQNSYGSGGGTAYWGLQLWSPNGEICYLDAITRTQPEWFGKNEWETRWIKNFTAPITVSYSGIRVWNNTCGKITQADENCCGHEYEQVHNIQPGFYRFIDGEWKKQ